MKYCRECHKELEADAVFCSKCGSKELETVISDIPVEDAPEDLNSGTGKKNIPVGFIVFLIVCVLMFTFVNKACSPSTEETAEKERQEMITDYIFKSQTVVSKFLVSPGTAKYPLYTDYNTFITESNMLHIKGYVDSQNGFGAMVRNDYYIVYDLDKDSIHSLNIDDKKIL